MEGEDVIDRTGRDGATLAQLKALADPTRSRIVELLLERRHCARSIAMTLGISDAAVSQHMSQLRACGLVSAYRHGHHMHYVLEEQPLRDLSQLFGSLADASTKVGDCQAMSPCRFKRQDGTGGCVLGCAQREDD